MRLRFASLAVALNVLASCTAPPGPVQDAQPSADGAAEANPTDAPAESAAPSDGPLEAAQEGGPDAPLDAPLDAGSEVLEASADAASDAQDAALDSVDVVQDACVGMVCNGSCVDTQSSVMHCGACGNACPARANAAVSCTAGACTLACNTGFADCDRDPSNGCESSLDTPAHCGGCSTVCAEPAPMCATAGSGASCVSGCSAPTPTRCAMSCVDTQSSVMHCGACGNACPARANAAVSCAAGACTLACNTGFADCDRDPSNGCETNVNTNTSNCGSCGNRCATTNTSPACSGGTCSVGTCYVGFADCDGMPFTGCETNVLSDPNNCGGCGRRCTLANASSTCVSGACAVSGCNAGFRDCNARPADGCETNVLTDPNNCGGCGVVCASGVCAAGQCLYAPTGPQTNVPVAALTGWTRCYIDTYNTILPFSQLTTTNCTRARLLIGCRATGAATLDVLAWAPRADVLFPIGASASSVTPHIANGTAWYADAGWSWGFAPGGDAITHFTCDTTTNVDAGLRLCWDTSGTAGGYRCGASRSLQNSTAYERVVYQAD